MTRKITRAAAHIKAGLQDKVYLGNLEARVDAARNAWWLNPEHPRNWGTGDSAAHEYAAIVRMVECRNLAQLGEFVHDLV